MDRSTAPIAVVPRLRNIVRRSRPQVACLVSEVSCLRTSCGTTIARSEAPESMFKTFHAPILAKFHGPPKRSRSICQDLRRVLSRS